MGRMIGFITSCTAKAAFHPPDAQGRKPNLADPEAQIFLAKFYSLPPSQKNKQQKKQERNMLIFTNSTLPNPLLWNKCC